jgi:hypothetical protein
MNWHVVLSFSWLSAGHSVSGGNVTIASMMQSRFSGSRVFSAARARRPWIAASPGSTMSLESMPDTVEAATDSGFGAGQIREALRSNDDASHCK